jgi:hypothetical protein
MRSLQFTNCHIIIIIIIIIINLEYYYHLYCMYFTYAILLQDNSEKSPLHFTRISVWNIL